MNVFWYLGFYLLYCCVTKATLFHLLTCIHDWESKSPKLSSLAIRHFSFIAGFVNALKHVPFTDANFKR
jgi:hypothetical protein